MRGKLTLLVGVGVGYVLGTKAGRQRYEQIKRKARQVWQDPRVQEKTDQAKHLAAEKAHHAGEVVQDKAREATEVLKDKVSSSEPAPHPGPQPPQPARSGPGLS